MSLLRYINSYEEVIGIPILLIYFSIMFNIIRKMKDASENQIIQDGIRRNDGFENRKKACETNFLELHYDELNKRKD